MNRVSLGLYTLTQNRAVSEPTAVNQSSSESSGLQLIPAIGYYRMLGKTVGIGLELGYGKEQTKAIYTSYAAGRTYFNENKTDLSRYFICPSLFEVFNSANGKYKFITSLAVPVTIMPKTDGSSIQQSLLDNATSVTTITLRNTNAPQTELALGLFLNGSAQRRLVGNLYAGPQLGIGATYTQLTVDGNSVYIQNPGQSSERRIETPVKTKTSSVAFGIRPMISLNYFF